MKHRVLALVGCAAIIAFARPVTYLAQESGRAADILALARQAIGNGRIDALKTFSLQSSVQRNVGSMQLNSDVEIYVELPDKYARVESMNGGPGMVIAGGGATGFNGDEPLRNVNAVGGPGGGMVIRMGGAPAPGGAAEKPTPQQLEQMKQAVFTARPAGMGRNTATTPGLWDVAGRLTYTFGFGARKQAGAGGTPVVVIRQVGGGAGDLLAGLGGGGADDKRVRLELFVSAANLFNTVNLTGYSGVMTSPFFLQPTAAGPARKIDFGMRIGF